MYVDNLLLEADTEYRRLTSAYDRQLSKQMARIDLELLKSIGHISHNSNLHQSLCQNAQDSLTELERCIRIEGPARIDDLINPTFRTSFRNKLLHTAYLAIEAIASDGLECR